MEGEGYRQPDKERDCLIACLLWAVLPSPGHTTCSSSHCPTAISCCCSVRGVAFNYPIFLMGVSEGFGCLLAPSMSSCSMCSPIASPLCCIHTDFLVLSNYLPLVLQYTQGLIMDLSTKCLTLV